MIGQLPGVPELRSLRRGEGGVVDEQRGLVAVLCRHLQHHRPDAAAGGVLVVEELLAGDLGALVDRVGEARDLIDRDMVAHQAVVELGWQHDRRSRWSREQVHVFRFEIVEDRLAVAQLGHLTVGRDVELVGVALVDVGEGVALVLRGFRLALDGDEPLAPGAGVGVLRIGVHVEIPRPVAVA